MKLIVKIYHSFLSLENLTIISNNYCLIRGENISIPAQNHLVILPLSHFNFTKFKFTVTAKLCKFVFIYQFTLIFTLELLFQWKTLQRPSVLTTIHELRNTIIYKIMFKLKLGPKGIWENLTNAIAAVAATKCVKQL